MVEDRLSEEILAGHIRIGDRVVADAQDGNFLLRKDEEAAIPVPEEA